MSFYNYNNDTQCPSPGPTTNAVDGLCERTCVQVKKVYDSCMQQVQMEDVTLDLADIQPNDRSFTAPLTFISCRGVPGQTRLSDVSVTRLAQGDNMARVRATMHIPIEVLFSDANGCEGMGRSMVTLKKDVVLYVPDDSIIPYTIEAASGAVCVTGTYCGGFRFRITVCLTAIMKVVADVELLIPSYGFCRVPPCREFAAGVCDDFFALPIYPPTQGCECPPVDSSSMSGADASMQSTGA